VIQMHWGKRTSLTRTAVLAVIFRTFPCAKSGNNMDFSTNSWSLSGTRNWLLGGGGGGDCERCNTGADVALPAPASDGSKEHVDVHKSTLKPQVSQSNSSGNWLLGGGGGVGGDGSGGGDCERCNAGNNLTLPAPASNGSQQEPGHVHSTRMPQVSQSLCGALAAGPALCAEGCTDASMEEDKLRLVGHCIYFGNLAPAFCAAQKAQESRRRKGSRTNANCG